MDKSTFLRLASEALNTKVEAIDEGLSLADLGWDSLANVVFISVVDDEFDVTLDADELTNCASLDDLSTLVENTIRAKLS